MIGFLFPALLLLLLPAGLAWWATRPDELAGRIVRAVIAVAIGVALAAPFFQRPAKGRDVIVVVDRSRSMPEGSDGQATELIRLLEQGREEGDRVGIVTFGQDAVVERQPSEQARFESFKRDPGDQGSELADAVDLALSLVPEDRAGSVLVLSDGEATGRELAAAGRQAAARGLPVHVRPLARPGGDDLSVAQLDVPGQVDVGEPFQFSAWIRSDREVTRRYVLTRDGEVLAQGTRTFPAGFSRLTFRDVLPEAGVAVVRLEIEAVGDPVPENNVGLAAVEADGRRPILQVNDTGAPDTLTRSLRNGGLDVHVASPETADLSRVGLTGYRAVILENVSADRVTLDGMSAITWFVTENGGGLLMTGGHASYGVGGYHESELDPILPVSLELRQEHRKVGMALSIALDRSGSMSMEAAPGVTKMDLANDGTAAAIRLLSPLDSVSVLAVDTAAHVVQEQTRVDDPGKMAKDLAHVQSMGGGIYTYNALRAAQQQLEKAPQQNKHVILFADAADAVQPEGVDALLDDWKAAGITVSVIALGTRGDYYAGFLTRVAEEGGGEIYFTVNPSDLPRLFALDTLVAARAAFIEEPTPTQPLPGLVGMGDLQLSSFPTLGGFNMTQLRPGATLAVVTKDEDAAPVLAYHNAGLGRVAVYTGQIGGTHGQSVVSWSRFSETFVTVTRWLALQEEPGDWYASARREGAEAVLTVEAGDDRVELPASLTVRLARPDGTLEDVLLERVGPTRFEGRADLAEEGVTLGVVHLGPDEAIELPPLALPHSPEFQHRDDPEAGRTALRKIASLSGGSEVLRVDAVWEDPSEGLAGRVVARPFILAALLLFMVEIAARRLGLWARLRSARPAPAPTGPTAPRRASRPRRSAASKPTPEEQRADPPDDDTPPPPADPPDQAGLGDALSKARSKARRKLDR